VFERVLIANRGEIAIRVARALRELDVVSIAVFSDADAGSPHLAAADLAVRIGPPPARESYLSIPALLDAASRTGAEAVHPGYGFLAESADFARACRDAGLVFIGPSPEAIELMGDKARARELARESGFPVVPGVEALLPQGEELEAFCAQHGFPILVKAVAGGGGKGMRIVHELGELEAAVGAATREAEAAFGDPRLLVERYLPAPRHLEVQVLADRHGNVLHLGERECSLQRRYQKVLEETPSPSVDDDLRSRMAEAAVALARACRYEGIGTVELIVPQEGDGSFYFLEMNTRLQVEHPVTELVTGVDLVQAQLRVAAGERLWLSQDEIRFEGHAIEARLYAEDPATGFLPVAGRLAAWKEPDLPGVRVDAGVRTGSEISVHYDPLLAKLIAHGADREAALRRLDRALAELTALGLRTNQSFLRAVLADEDVRAGRLDTELLGRLLPRLEPGAPADLRHAAALALFLEDCERSGGSGTLPFGWRSSGPPIPRRARLQIGREQLEVSVSGTPAGAVVEEAGAQLPARVERVAEESLRVEIAGVARVYQVVRVDEELWVGRDGSALGVRRARRERSGERSRVEALEAPMPGVVVLVHARNGDRIRRGDPLLVLESMKTEMPIRSPQSGRVDRLMVEEGDRVRLRQPLALIAPGEEAA
jgi:acetyl-CoA/propionyl-CoA carboxylase biotin carboxyl carrier protein